MNLPPHESPTQALYRAALGPVQSEHHLRAFERFDALGASRPSWNWAAALLTLNWLMFRRLWRIAALYALLVAAAGGALWGLAWGRLPDGVTLGLAGAVALLATAVPGLFGNAWLHGQLRLALVEAVRQAPSMTDAADALRRRAPSLQRLGVMCLLNLLLIAAGASWWWQRGGSSPHAVAAQAGGPETAVNLVTEVVTRPAVAVQAAEPPSTTAPSFATEQAPAPVQAAASTAVPAAPSAAPETPSAPSASATPTAPVPKPPSVASAPTTATTPATPALAEAPEPEAQSVSEPIAQAAARGYGINVGLFADPANAQRTLARIRQAGLPARSDTVSLERGNRTRVRAGPFASRAEADQAARRIRALGLEAQVFRQGARE